MAVQQQQLLPAPFLTDVTKDYAKDLGAKRMENLMGAMENKKGAKQMFDVSERLSEVV